MIQYNTTQKYNMKNTTQIIQHMRFNSKKINTNNTTQTFGLFSFLSSSDFFSLQLFYVYTTRIQQKIHTTHLYNTKIQHDKTIQESKN